MIAGAGCSGSCLELTHADERAVNGCSPSCPDDTPIKETSDLN
jgi:hypothetical protein